MQNDTNTYGYNQWFYFSIRNMTPNVKYTFKIVNYVQIASFRENPTLFLKRGNKFLLFLFLRRRPTETDGTEMEQAYVTIHLYFDKRIVRNTTLYSSTYNLSIRTIMWLFLLTHLTVIQNWYLLCEYLKKLPIIIVFVGNWSR